MADYQKGNESSPAIASNFLVSVGGGQYVPSNTEAYQTALAILTPALHLLAAPEIQDILKKESFRMELSASWITHLAGDSMLETAMNPKERLFNRVDYAQALLRQLPDMMDLKSPQEDGYRQLLTSHADALKLCSERHIDGSGNLDLTDPVSAADGEISRLQAILAGKLGLREVYVVGKNHDGGDYQHGAHYIINRFDPQIR